MDLFPKTFLTRDSDPSNGTVKCRQQVKKVVPILLRLFEILEPATDPFFFIIGSATLIQEVFKWTSIEHTFFFLWKKKILWVVPRSGTKHFRENEDDFCKTKKFPHFRSKCWENTNFSFSKTKIIVAPPNGQYTVFQHLQKKGSEAMAPLKPSPRGHHGVGGGGGNKSPPLCVWVHWTKANYDSYRNYRM